MANVCGRCKHLMSSLDDHASCPLCRITAGECHVDVDNPCFICGKWTSKQWNSLGGLWCSPERRPVREGGSIGTSAFSHLEAWIISRPALSASSSGPTSEISSLVSGDDFSDRLLVSTSSLLAHQDLVVQLKMVSIWRLVWPLQHPVGPLRHPVRHPCR